MSKVKKAHSLEKEYVPTDPETLERESIAAGRFPCESCKRRLQQTEIWNGICKQCLRKLVKRNKSVSGQRYSAITYADLKHEKLGNPMASYHAVHITVVVVSLIVALIALTTA